MGIRYYGWALSPAEVVEALDDPWPVIQQADRRHDCEGWTNTDFDKAWWMMQRLFAPDGESVRPGYDLVAGDVTYPNGYEQGYVPHVGVLAAERVPAIARDVASVSRSDVRSLCRELFGLWGERRDDEGYLAHYLKEAQGFTADAAARGHGIVYQIG